MTIKKKTQPKSAAKPVHAKIRGKTAPLSITNGGG